MDFNIKNVFVFEIGGVEVWITQTIINTWIIMGFLIVLAVAARIAFRNFKEIPKGAQNVIESIIEMFENFVKNSAGQKVSSIGGWFFAAFSFILLSNLSGLVGLRPPTADWATTFAFALATFIMIQFMALKHRGGAYIKEFFQPIFIFFPLNLIGELARPISLSFRLFGNILAGMVIMSLIYSMAPIFVRIGLPSFLHAYFDVFGGALQTYIFCVLSMTFIGGAAGSTEEDAV